MPLNLAVEKVEKAVLDPVDDCSVPNKIMLIIYSVSGLEDVPGWAPMERHRLHWRPKRPCQFIHQSCLFIREQTGKGFVEVVVQNVAEEVLGVVIGWWVRAGHGNCR